MVIRNVEIARAVHGHASRGVDLGVRRRAAIAEGAVRTVSRHGGDYSAGYLPDTIIGSVADVQTAGAACRNAIRFTDAGVYSQTAVSRGTTRTVARHRGD